MSRTLRSISQLDDRYLWSGYFALLMCVGYAQLWDARLFTWFTDDFDYLNHVEHLNRDLWLLFSPDLVSSGRPTTSLFFLFFHTIFGEQQVPYHLGLIFFHILTTGIVAWSLYRIGHRIELSMVAGLLLLLNVNRYEVAYWLSCFSYLGCMSFGCLAMVAFGRYSTDRRIPQLIAAVGLILLSASFHAGAVGFAVLAAWFAWRQGGDWRQIVASGWILAAACVGLSWLIYTAYPMNEQNKNVTHLGDIFHNIQVWLAYLGRTYLSPHWLSRALALGPSALDVVAGSALALVAAGLVKFRRGLALDAIVWSAVTLVVFSGSTNEEFRSRYFYYASVGPSLLIGWSLLNIPKLIGEEYRSRFGLTLTAASLIGLAAVSQIHHQKAESVFRAVIGRSYLAGVGGGGIQGLHEMKTGIEGAPGNLHRDFYIRYGVNAWYAGLNPVPALELGLGYFPEDEEIRLLKDTAEIIVSGRTPDRSFLDDVKATGSRSMVSSVSRALHNAGSRSFNEGHYGVAETLYATAILLDPNYVSATRNYANTLVFQERVDHAAIAFGRFFDIAPESRYGDALPGLQKALTRSPENAEIRSFLASALVAVGRLDEAITCVEEGLRHLETTQVREMYAEIGRMLEDDDRFEAAEKVRVRIKDLAGTRER